MSKCKCGKSKLERMWDAQDTFYQLVRSEKKDLSDQQFCHSIILHLYTEVKELLDAVGGPWKTHVKESTNPRKSQILMETVDVTKLAWEIAIAAGVTEEEFHEAFMQKSLIVENRRHCERFLNHPNQSKTVIFDFDGVLVYYPEGFLDFVKSQTGIEVAIDALRSPDDLWTQLGIPLDKYQELKRQFIEGGGLLSLEPVAEAVKLVEDLRVHGYSVAIVTSRDKAALEKMELDSYRWLLLNDVKVDGIYFTLDKARFVKKHFCDVRMFIDDNPLEVERMKEAGIPAMCLDRPYNKNDYGNRSGVSFTRIRQVLFNG